MVCVENEEFTGLYDEDSGHTFEDLEFVSCVFRSCGLSMAQTLRARSHVRRVTLRDCEAYGCFVMNPILEQVNIQDLRSGTEPVFTWGALFDRVRIVGKVGNLVLSPRVDPPTFPDADAAEFDAARTAFYSNVSWALDITEVRPENLEIYGVPGDLVRYDPEHQAVVQRENVLNEQRWRDLDLSATWWSSVLEAMVTQGYEHAVLATPLDHPRAEAFVKGIAALREAGVADPAQRD